MTSEELKMLQALPLDVKILKTHQRVREWVDYYGIDGVYVSYSGGKDSTVLAHIVNELYDNIPIVYCNTGLEYTGVREMVKATATHIIRPKMTPKDIIEKYGYPLISKEQSNYIYRCQNTKSEGEYNKYYNGINRDGSKTQFKVSEKYKYLVGSGLKVSDKCCDKLKKEPFKRYEKETGRVAIIGTMACESKQRERLYKAHGCNSYNKKRPTCQPLSFWTEQDILGYIYINKIKIAKEYGNIMKLRSGYTLTGEQRTGCLHCLYGLQYDTERFERLKENEPLVYKYCMEVLNYENVFKILKKGE